uniref:Uncharacterized protein n=1 Tax=Helianthus annuus TaxID=4232 RepID=A0A251TBI9_HELAN
MQNQLFELWTEGNLGRVIVTNFWWFSNKGDQDVEIESTVVLVYCHNQWRKPSSQMGFPRLTMAAMFGYKILTPWRSYMEKRELHMNCSHVTTTRMTRPVVTSGNLKAFRCVLCA